MRTLRYGTLAAVLLTLGTLPVLAQEPTAENSVMLLVNGAPLYEIEVRQIYDNLRRVMTQQGLEITPEELKQEAIDQGVAMKLLVQEAGRRGIEVDSTRVAAIVQGIEDEAGGPEGLVAGLAENGLSVGDLQRGIEERELIRIFMEQEMEPSVQVNDEDVNAYYEANTERFGSPETVHARHMLFRADAAAGEEAMAAARALATEARERAVAGEDFAELAKELSQGPSAASGGDLGFFSAEQMVDPFAEAAFALEIGAISEVVATRFGFHVIKVEEKRTGGLRSLEEVAEPLQEMLVQEKLAKNVETLLDGLKDKAKVHPPAPVSPEAGS